MTAPRWVTARRLFFLTRTIAHRQFLATPSEEVNQIFEYCIAEAARKFQIKTVVWKVMGNHFHLCGYDELGNVPAFAERAHKLIAKAMNKFLDRTENFWSSDPVCITYCATVEDLFEKAVYTLTNAVAADLVDTAADWPGASAYEYLDGNERIIQRPKYYFKKNSKVMTPTVTLRAEIPPGAGPDWHERLRNAVAEREKTLREIRREAKKPVVGREAVLATPRYDSPKTPRETKLRPHIACKDKEERIRLLLTIKGFRAEYKSVREAFRDGQNKDLAFPPGTYRLRLMLGVRIADTAKPFDPKEKPKKPKPSSRPQKVERTRPPVKAHGECAALAEAGSSSSRRRTSDRRERHRPAG